MCLKRYDLYEQYSWNELCMYCMKYSFINQFKVLHFSMPQQFISSPHLPKKWQARLETEKHNANKLQQPKLLLLNIKQVFKINTLSCHNTHPGTSAKIHLHFNFHGQWISHCGPQHCSYSSPDVNPLYFYLGATQKIWCTSNKWEHKTHCSVKL
jgi:hypothetical protein